MSFIAKIEKIIEWVDFLALEWVKGPTSFEAGLDPDEVVQKLEAAGIPPLAELVQLYSWANGCWFIEGVHLSMSSLESAIVQFSDWHPDYQRPRSWFPIADINGDVWIFLDIETLALHSGGRKLADHYEVALDALLDGLSADGAGWDEEYNTIHLGPGVAEDVMARYSVDYPW